MQKQQVYLRDTSISCPEKYIGLTSKKLQRDLEAISVSCDLGFQKIRGYTDNPASVSKSFGWAEHIYTCGQSLPLYDKPLNFIK